MLFYWFTWAQQVKSGKAEKCIFLWPKPAFPILWPFHCFPELPQPKEVEGEGGAAGAGGRDLAQGNNQS